MNKVDTWEHCEQKQVSDHYRSQREDYKVDTWDSKRAVNGSEQR